MNAYVSFVLLLCLAVVHSHETTRIPLRKLREATRIPTTASATATATSAGGKAVAKSEARAQPFVFSEEDIKAYFEFVFEKLEPIDSEESVEDYCSEALETIEKVLLKAGTSSAAALASATATVYVEGIGEACAAADAQVIAEFYRDELISVIKSVAPDIEGTETIVKVYFAAFRSIFAEAYAATCIEGEGYSKVVQETLGLSLSEPLASIGVYLASGGVDCTDQPGYCTTETIHSKLGAEEKEEEIESCSGMYYLCCLETSDVCTCSRTRISRCRATLKKTEDGVSYWEDKGEGTRCTCDQRHTGPVRHYDVTVQT